MEHPPLVSTRIRRGKECHLCARSCLKCATTRAMTVVEAIAVAEKDKDAWRTPKCPHAPAYTLCRATHNGAQRKRAPGPRTWPCPSTAAASESNAVVFGPTHRRHVCARQNPP